MSKHTWLITLNKYDHSGLSYKTVKADSCNIDEENISFYKKEKGTEESTFPEFILTAYIPQDRVFEIEILDPETGEPVGFVFEGDK